MGRRRGIGCNGVGIKREVTKDMIVGMEVSASEGNMFIVECLDPINVMIDECYGFREEFGKIHVYTNSCIRGIMSHFGGL
jgi:hypothetical protein